MKRVVVFIAIAAAHFVVSMVLFFRSFAYTMDSMDSGLSPTMSQRIVGFASDALLFPLVPLAGLLPELLGPLADVSFVLNSLLWSAVICAGWSVACRRWRGVRLDSSGQ